MAQPTRRERPVRTLVTLGVLIVALFGALISGSHWSTATLTPKLALDLEGGTQIILTPVAENQAAITDATITQAIDVIRQRVDSSGVAEAEITSQGGRNIVVALPGTPSEETLNLVRTSAQMEFRPVLGISAPTPTDTSTATATPTDAATPAADAAATPTPSATATAAPSDTPTKAAPDNPSDTAYYITPKVEADFLALDCTNKANQTGGKLSAADKALVACDPTGSAKYLLGPVEIQGKEISSASSGLGVGANGTSTGKWVVNIQFTGTGGSEFRVTTTRLQGLTSPQNQFAMVLDGLVISAPSLAPGVIITDGKAEISGSFTRLTAATLANQLNFGALPLTFTVQSEQTISASLGSEQLEKGIIAGLIGLLLVVVYSLLQYRTLGLVTVASLVIAGLITYGVITVLSWTQGYRLSLPGVTGLIVAIGITADSFIVYFERVRDELREGRTLPAAIEKGWERARRTILASDAVNFLAAVVLYFLAVGGVRGFAFTLGLTTIIDLVVVFCFTHPMLAVLAKTEFFGHGHPASGLDPRRLGAPQTPRYAGRGRIVTGQPAVAPDRLAVPGEKVPAVATVGSPSGHQTIAERRAAARAAAASSAPPAEGTEPLPPDTTSTAAEAEPTSGRTEGNEL
ncbi:protein translocase subunit SecD [Cellulomonas sp. WB94]|uniref:protein translocase subunit SecD n=1 Tax=Cellulomonas sp. WB94 TaxID=2173174 RepID=UPI000D564598|nr:protein translocase subunit SecD [Cellulomonas sp. WB94]PVU81119.1 protein translocase subunit SecD [Cellulomonas sp. WB94]